MSLLSKGIKGSYPIIQSAAVLLLASSSSSLLLSPPIFGATTRTSRSTSISRSQTNIPFGSWNYHTSFYHNTAKMSLAPHLDVDCDTDVNGVEEHYQQQEDNQTLLLLPYVEGSHRSAKIVIPHSCTSPSVLKGNIEQEDCDIGSVNVVDYDSMSISEFQQRLDATILVCRQLGKAALWIEVPMSQARYIEAMENVEGLDLHHISSKTGTIHLNLWLKEDVENKIPEYATHQVGVGAMVVNSKNEILCVRELRNNYRPWKIPGGLADLGEQLEEAAIREVMEETGIVCEFQSVLGFRHTHGLQFGRSDLYFICRLAPIETKDENGNVIIPEPIAQESEIAAVSWIPLQEYRDMVNGVMTGEPHPMMQKMISLHDLEECDIQRTVINSIVPGRKPSPMYHICSKEKNGMNNVHD